MNGNGMPYEDTEVPSDTSSSLGTSSVPDQRPQPASVAAVLRAHRSIAAFQSGAQAPQGENVEDEWGIWDAVEPDPADEVRLAPMPAAPASVLHAAAEEVLPETVTPAPAPDPGIAELTQRLRTTTSAAANAAGSSRWKRVLRVGSVWTAIVAAWVLLGLVVALTWGTHVFEYRTHVIVGESMEPTIPLYSVIIGKPVPPEAIHEGDIITFTPPNGNKRVTHRVVGVNFDDGADIYFQTQGDNNDSPDPWQISYVGDDAWLVTDHVPYVGRLLMWMQSPAGRIVLVIIPTLLMLAAFLRWIWRPRKRAAADTEGGADTSSWAAAGSDPPSGRRAA